MNITTRNLHEHTAQQVFDYIYRKIVEQGKPAVRSNGACAYRGLEQTKCAAGQIIDEPDYRFVLAPDHGELGSLSSWENEDFDNLGWARIPDSEVDAAFFSDPDADIYQLYHRRVHGTLMRSLQSAHDAAALNTASNPARFLETYKASMRSVAYSFDLNTDALQ